LCPGINDVIRSIVHTLTYGYGVRIIKGVQYGYAGLNPASKLPLVDLTPEAVRHIHEDGGTCLGSSRGPQPAEVMVDTLYREDIRVLFAIGGDGTLRGALDIHDEIKRRGMSVAVVGIPKTIDNDIGVVARTFGFDTAVATATESLRAAHVEATNAINGIGIVKLMGRHSGFVAASAALAAADANFVLVPEVPFDLGGPKGFLRALEDRLTTRGHALVVVAEGAGQELFEDELGTDASGNAKLGDIGVFLKSKIAEYLTRRGLEHTIKYIDPSYTIRSVPANPNDCIFCGFLGQHAAHAAMAGKTGLLIGVWNNLFIHVPIELAVRKRKQIDPQGILWTSVLESTGQPKVMVND
jgi:6-phosphofructokinase 1